MRELVSSIRDWLSRGHRFALATVTHIEGSAPRPVGSILAVRQDGVTAGSVSGGCVESAVVQAALEVLAGGPPRLVQVDSVEEGELWNVGLSCGGAMRIWVTQGFWFSSYASEVKAGDALFAALDNREACALVRSLDPSYPLVALVDSHGRSLIESETLTESVVDEAMRRYNQNQSGEVEIDSVPCFVHLFPSPERLIIVGAVHIAEPLVLFARVLGFETVVIDPRSPAGESLKPDGFIQLWPQEAISGLALGIGDYCVTLSHDPKIDDPALIGFLQSPVRYVGALGGRRTHNERCERLTKAGVSGIDLQRIHCPVGLNLGALSAEEIALSISAEIVKVRRGA